MVSSQFIVNEMIPVLGHTRLNFYKEASVIQRKILKAQAFVSRSVHRVLKTSRSQKKPLGKFSFSRHSDASPDKSSPLLNSPLVLFAREVLQNPRSFGAACPSSPHLARAVAELTPADRGGLIVELGAGTGIVLKGLLKQGIPPEQIVGIERSAQLSVYLRQNFSACQIIEGDALHLCDLLGDQCQQINTIICGLPFRTLPERVVHGIVRQIEEALPKEGLYLQYTYDLSKGKPSFLPHNFRRISSKIVWGNLPPARLNLYQVDRNQN